jgi:small GTP-binding protein
MDAAVSTPSLRIALIGVPNCGKTALFNRLTGSRQKVANYPGVTVERREGERAADDGRVLRILDLPGTYSLSPTTLDEAITRDVLLGRVADAPAPELVVCVVDAVHMPIGLRLALEVKRLGLPMVLALNRMDVAKKRGVTHRCVAPRHRTRCAGAADHRREARRRRCAHRGHSARAMGAPSQHRRAGLAGRHGGRRRTDPGRPARTAHAVGYRAPKESRGWRASTRCCCTRSTDCWCSSP